MLCDRGRWAKVAGWSDHNFSEFSARMRAEGLGEPEIYDAARHDAAFLMALAMQSAGSTEADAMKAELRAASLAEEGDTLIEFGEWEEARAAILAGEGINYEGPSGPIEFSPEGDPTSGTFVVWTTAPSGDGFEFEILDTKTFTAP
jgi:ABC-type branched-subunit amino acid transport system substrate-binding protein